MARGPYRGQYGSSQSSRSSRVHMPPIAEDEPRDQSDSAALAVATTMAAGRPPRTPLRVPPKISQAAPPPYVPVTHISPPRYNDDDGSVAASSESFEGRRSSDAARFEKQQQVQHHDHQFVEGGSRLKRWADRQWFGSRRKRWAVFVSLGLLAVSIAVGLAVGLTFGLRDGRR